jgi:hypothetical protein
MGKGLVTALAVVLVALVLFAVIYFPIVYAPRASSSSQPPAGSVGLREFTTEAGQGLAPWCVTTRYSIAYVNEGARRQTPHGTLSCSARRSPRKESWVPTRSHRNGAREQPRAGSSSTWPTLASLPIPRQRRACTRSRLGIPVFRLSLRDHHPRHPGAWAPSTAASSSVRFRDMARGVRGLKLHGIRLEHRCRRSVLHRHPLTKPSSRLTGSPIMWF